MTRPNPSRNQQQCSYETWCVLKNGHLRACRPADAVTVKQQNPAVSELLIWLPEWCVAGLFFFGALVAGGLLSLACLLISLAAVAWIVANRAMIRRRNEQVLRAYEQNTELVAADAKLLENGTDR